MRKLLGIICGIILIILYPTMLFSESELEVSITIKNQGVLTSKKFTGDATIIFNNIELYNENVKFSYHIYDEKGEVLIFENERSPFVLDENRAVIPLNIDFEKYHALSGMNKFIVKFDLVDEQNIYWFSDNRNINFEPYCIQYDLSMISIAKQKYTQIIQNQKSVLVINIIFDIGIVVLLFFIYKKKHREL